MPPYSWNYRNEAPYLAYWDGGLNNFLPGLASNHNVYLLSSWDYRHTPHAQSLELFRQIISLLLEKLF
jgi:hypothetical protein